MQAITSKTRNFAKKMIKSPRKVCINNNKEILEPQTYQLFPHFIFVRNYKLEIHYLKLIRVTCLLVK